jgi:hypothetical protein
MSGKDEIHTLVLQGGEDILGRFPRFEQLSKSFLQKMPNRLVIASSAGSRLAQTHALQPYF